MRRCRRLAERQPLFNYEVGSVERSVRQTASFSKVSTGRIAQADTVLQFAPELADEVMSGATPLGKAYAEATEAQMMRLREIAPDLARDHALRWR